MLVLPISLTFAAALAVINLWLAVRVGRFRISEKILHGDGGVPTIQKRMRAHANFAEYAPFVLILLVLVELASGSPIWLWGVAALYIAARLMHAIGMDFDAGSKFRTVGFALNAIVLLALAIAALLAVYRSSTTAEPKISGSYGLPVQTQ